MAEKNEKDLTLKQGKSTEVVIRCEIPDVLVYRPITAISKTAPVRLTVPIHDLKTGQRAAVTGVVGMKQINAEANNVRDSDYKPVTVIGPDTIDINSINALLFSDYVSGGAIQYYQPLDLASFKGRLYVKDKAGTILHEMTSENGLILMDATNRAITLFFDSEDVASFTWKTAKYELEIYKSITRNVQPPGGGAPVAVTTDTVYQPAFGQITVETEVAKP